VNLLILIIYPLYSTTLDQYVNLLILIIYPLYSTILNQYVNLLILIIYPLYSTIIDQYVCRVVNRFLFLFSIVFKNDRFVFGKKRSFWKTLIKKTTNYIKTIVFGKTIVCEVIIYMQLYWMSSYMKLKNVGELKLFDIFLKTTQW